MYRKIRLNSTNSANSVNTDMFIDISMKQHTKLFPFPSVTENIDQYEVFLNERASCNKYRIILTINPFCTNVLFNTLTEITKGEGTDNIQIVSDNSSIDIPTAKGKKIGISRDFMIENTEYSREGIDYEYHCGYDFFNNHILRNKSFKIVNTIKNNDPEIDKFNTIEDNMRLANGNQVSYVTRKSIENLTRPGMRHLYIYDDIMSIDESINANVMEENGWYGFTNNSTVDAMENTKFKYNDNDKRYKWKPLDISRALNNHGNCEFIDMYPDRTLFLFNPKYNKFYNREEYNWDICLTYPYENDEENVLLKNTAGDGQTNGLLVDTINVVIAPSGERILAVKTYTKHGLNAGDNLRIYYSNDNDYSYEHFEKYIEVVDIGDISHNNGEYYFIVRNSDDFLISLVGNQYETTGKTSEEIVEESNEFLKGYKFRIRRVINDCESIYYFRKFRKIPNLRSKKEELTEDIASDSTLYNTYVDNNARENGKGTPMKEFTREIYPLAFSNTIYGDSCTQVTFTDSVDLEHIKDNLGRPLSEIYVTIIKRNKGHEEWYNKMANTEDHDEPLENPEVEYSHCFGKVSAGVEMLHKETTYSDEMNDYATKSDITLINELGCFDAQALQEDITINNDIFYGDICEYNGNECIEHVLQDVFFRFNTAQREENRDGFQTNYKFSYQEIVGDDFDLDGWGVVTAKNQDTREIGGVKLITNAKPEGYYYKPHYKLQIKNLSEIKQNSHYDLPLSSARIVQNEGIFVEITSRLPHNLSNNDIIYITDTVSGITREGSVAYVIDKRKAMIKSPKELNWVRLCTALVDSITNDDKKVILRKKNKAIPSYATKVGDNDYLWRDVLNVNDLSNGSVINYPFTNGHFYITPSINFFLKRQDPFGESGLYADGTTSNEEFFPNDVFGNIKKISDKEYKQEKETTC